MQFQSLFETFQVLQKKHGAPELDPIYGAGCIDSPDICFVFMNPTGRNVTSSKDWRGIKAPWIGTKQVWKLLEKTDYFSSEIKRKIDSLKPEMWTTEFANSVYKNLADNKVYLTNLAKCTQVDARPLKNVVFQDYLDSMFQELEMLNPKVIITFGNQVSSILLEQNISVSKTRKTPFKISGRQKEYTVFPIFYPVGQGTRNIDKSIEDIKWIRERHL